MTVHQQSPAGFPPADHLPLLSEYLRPTRLEDLTLPDRVIGRFQAIAASGSIPNFLFYGEPGTGKTSAARIFIKEIEADCVEINGSLGDGDKTMSRRIETFASARSLFGKPKVCFIDEADYLTKEVQASLRNIVERVSANTRFILTVNERNRLTPAIKSRFVSVSFDVKASHAPDVMRRMISRYGQALRELGYSPDMNLVTEVVQQHFPDLRAIASHLQFEVMYVDAETR